MALQAIVVWQGLHLIQSGYDIDLTKADPSAIGRTAARSRGKGGIILLIIQFFPYFLVGGYTFLAWHTYKWLGNSNRRIPSLVPVYSFLLDADSAQKKQMKDLVSMVQKQHSEKPYATEMLASGAIDIVNNSKDDNGLQS